jgi:hypothetical protein
MIVELRVAAPRFVPSLDELQDYHACLVLGFEAAAVEQFAFERGKETLAHCVIEAYRRPKAVEVYWLPGPNDESRRRADAARGLG